MPDPSRRRRARQLLYQPGLAAQGRETMTWRAPDCDQTLAFGESRGVAWPKKGPKDRHRTSESAPETERTNRRHRASDSAPGIDLGACRSL